MRGAQRRAGKSRVIREIMAEMEHPTMMIVTRLIELLDMRQTLEIRALVDERLANLERQELEDDLAESAGQAEAKSKARGYVELKRIRGFGPYAYRRWREGGRLRSEYLGKAVVTG